MRICSRIFLVAVAAFLSCSASHAQEPHKTKNVIFIMTDGLRRQEIFSGAQEDIINKKFGKVEEEAALRKAYWRATPEERREALMPFLWTVIAKQGQIYGNRDKGSDAFVTNGKFFSYPGYSETMCGFADTRIDSNDNVPNPNVTVFEWLNQKPEFHDRLAAFGAWNVIAAVFNPGRSGLVANAGYDPLRITPSTTELDLLNTMKAELPHVWGDEPFDAIPFYTAIEYLKTKKPRVLYISLGETDDWAHGREYMNYLDAAHRVDAYLQKIWELVQSMPEYKDNTTLIFSPDHGRGASREKWTDHGDKAPDSKYIWMAFLGPDTRPLGERSHTGEVTQSQIAATLAALLGEDYNASVSKAGKPIADVIH